MHNVKYVIGKVRVMGMTAPVETAILFPETLTHADAAQAFGYLGAVVSAGFATWSPVAKKYAAHGFSASLDAGARPIDSEIINRQFGHTA